MTPELPGISLAEAGARLRPATFAAWFAIALLVIYLVLIGGAYNGIYAAPIRVTTVVLAAVALGVWLFAARARHIAASSYVIVALSRPLLIGVLCGLDVCVRIAADRS